MFGGEYHSAFKGRGIEFAEVRPYQVGDDVRTIDWNVSARTGEPHVKLFEEEREQTLLLVVDVSGSEDFGSAAPPSGTSPPRSAPSSGSRRSATRTRWGWSCSPTPSSGSSSRKRGSATSSRLLRDLFAHQARQRGTDVAAALDHVLRVQRRRAIVVLVSDFLVPEGTEARLAKSLRVVAQKHDVVAVRLTDPREHALPAVGLLRVVDSESGRASLVDTSSRSVREAFAARAAARAGRVDGALKAGRVDHVTLRTDADYVEPLSSFFRHRARR